MKLLEIIKKASGFRNSIFAKITLIIFAAVVIINVIIFLFFIVSARHSRWEKFAKNYVFISEHIVVEIGSPPDYAKAALISEKSGFDIIIDGPGGKWSSAKAPIDVKIRRIINENGGFKIGLFRGILTIETQKGQYTFTLITKESMSPLQWNTAVIFLVFLITSLMVVLYFLIKKQLRPIKNLIHGIERISDGDMSFKVPVSSNDELGLLTDSFNKMNTKILEMIRLKEQLLLDVSHEMRSPLTRMRIALEFVPECEVKDSVREDILLLDSMLAEILEAQKNFKGSLSLTLEKMSLYDLINSSLKLLNAEERKINIKFASGDVIINVDKIRARTALRNIVENSLKYSLSENSPVEISAETDDSHAIIRVTDHGIGIPEKEIPFIFEPFYRTDRSRSRDTGGFGLGLSIVKRIMDAHGGSVEINSDSGMTTAILKFPRL